MSQGWCRAGNGKQQGRRGALRRGRGTGRARGCDRRRSQGRDMGTAPAVPPRSTWLANAGLSREDATLACWGYDEIPATDRSPVPEGRFTAVAAGREHACAIRDDQSLVCWPARRMDLRASPP